MKTIVIACQKGGVGKSTLALNLLVEAVSRGISAIVWDQDSQGTFDSYSQDREQKHGQCLPFVTERPRAGSSDLLIIDTAPHANAELPRIFSGADLVLVPSRISKADRRSAQTTLDVGRRINVAMAAVLMVSDDRSPELTEARSWLIEQDVPLAGLIHQRVDIARAGDQGLGISELLPKHLGTLEFRRIADYAFKMIV